MSELAKNWTRVRRSLRVYTTDDDQLTQEMFALDTARLLGLKVKVNNYIPVFTVDAILVCKYSSRPRTNVVYVMGFVDDPDWPHLAYSGTTLCPNENMDRLDQDLVIDYLTLRPELDKFKVISDKMAAVLLARELEQYGGCDP